MPLKRYIMQTRRIHFMLCAVAGAALGVQLTSGTDAAIVVGVLGVLAVSLAVKVDESGRYATAIHSLIDRYESELKDALSEFEGSMHSALQAPSFDRAAGVQGEPTANLQRIVDELTDSLEVSSYTPSEHERLQNLAKQFREALEEVGAENADTASRISLQIGGSERRFEQANRSAVAKMIAALNALDPPSSLRAKHVRVLDAFQAFNDGSLTDSQPSTDVGSTTDEYLRRFQALTYELQASVADLSTAIAGRA